MPVVVGVLLEVGLELLGRLRLELDRRETGLHDDFGAERLGGRLVEQVLAVPGREDLGLHRDAVLLQTLHDREVAVGDHAAGTPRRRRRS